jgi:hypothetical protein
LRGGSGEIEKGASRHQTRTLPRTAHASPRSRTCWVGEFARYEILSNNSDLGKETWSMQQTGLGDMSKIAQMGAWNGNNGSLHTWRGCVPLVFGSAGVARALRWRDLQCAVPDSQASGVRRPRLATRTHNGQMVKSSPDLRRATC